MEDRVLLSTLTVTNDNDRGSGTLRAEVGAAVAGDTIVFAPSAYGTITLANGALSLPDRVTIDGPGAGQVTISGGGKVRVFKIAAGVRATVSGLTITGGSGANGGAVYNQGTATFTNCNITSSSAQHDGGGLYNQGTATFTGCTISGNSAKGDGGGLDNQGTVTFTDCTISGNQAQGHGGGLYNQGTATITDTTVSGNSSGIDNGAGLAIFGGKVTLMNTIVAGNLAGYVASDIGGPHNVASSSAYNLIGTGGSGSLKNAINGNEVGISNPGLAPLGNYGGPTLTMPLLSGSPAIGKGTSIKGITTDQRGMPLGTSVDIGAFQDESGLVVNTTVDGAGSPAGELTLRQAIDLADALQISSAGNPLDRPQTITFDPTVFAKRQTITLTDGELALTNTLGAVDAQTYVNIDGPGAAMLTVSGGKTSRVFQVDPMVVVNISGLSITGGAAGSVGRGGGLYNQGTTTLSDCTISGNSAEAGGGVGSRPLRYGSLALNDCTISGNSASNGGGVYNYGDGTISGCTITNNSAARGAGVMNAVTGESSNSEFLTINNSTISGNSSGKSGIGGGLSNANGVKVYDCTISGNSAGKGGGVYNTGSYFGSATLSDCTISGNSAEAGGGVYNRGLATLVNCTISGNAASDGGGLYDGQKLGGYRLGLSLTNCTVAGNTAATNGGGLFDKSEAVLNNTIVAANTSSSGSPSAISGEVTSSSSYNLIGAGGSGGLTNSQGNLVGVADPGLGSLANNGGPTLTIALLSGSPAINAGSIALVPAGFTTDQRGTGFPRIVGKTVDIGAFENSIASNT
jgi:hypothetical protein